MHTVPDAFRDGFDACLSNSPREANPHQTGRERLWWLAGWYAGRERAMRMQFTIPGWPDLSHFKETRYVPRQ